jgi:DNA-binding beta-propeller fold protein YncE
MRTFLVASCTLAAATLAACSSSSTSPSHGTLYAIDSEGESAGVLSARLPIGQTASDLKRESLRKVPQPANSYTLFESLQVRPLALSADGELLFAANTPDNRLEIFRVHHDRLDPIASVAVGLEPVAVATRGDEVWVANHLSDSVSIVDVSDPFRPKVTRTLLVGDEPRDIVFAGPHHDRAFITTAHRGQNSTDDPDLFTPGVGRADVWVFDADNLGAAPGGTRLTKLTFFADTPRALAASADGKTVYAAAFFSGDQTTVVSDGDVATMYPNGMPGPATVPFGGGVLPQPNTGLIVKWKQGADGAFHWLDAYGTVFDKFVAVSLPDNDVFAIDATKNPPAPAAGVYSHVGTTLFNMAVNPKSGKVYVSNTDAHNDVRFEGHTAGFTSVAGNIVDSRITVIDPASGSITADNLNPHIDHVAGTGDATLSRAFPQDLTVSRDGKELYVVAQGSSKLAIYDTAALEAGSATPTAANQVTLSGGGPTGVVVNERHHTAFVLTRFDNAISVVDLGSKTEKGHVAMWSPEPASVTAGRQFLYDAAHTSTFGDQACASCHIGGDFDGLAWDLGNPGATPLPITKTFANELDAFTIPQANVLALFGPDVAGLYAFNMPVKGPMTTQSLRGLDNSGAMHWRGDRNGAIQQTGLPFLTPAGTPVASAQPNGGIFDEVNAFTSFNVAFPGLLGNPAEISAPNMSAFATFALQITYPPNPIRNLDNTLTPTQSIGAQFYSQTGSNGAELAADRSHNCNGCHVLDRNGNAGATAHPGFFGTDGKLSFEGESQIFKVPHLRNAYQKVGMYGAARDSGHALASIIPQLNPPVKAVRGFGFNHDGIEGTPEQFLSAIVFIQSTVPMPLGGPVSVANPNGIPFFADPTNPLDPTTGISIPGLELRQALASFIFAFDTNLFPVVGQQLTLSAGDASDAGTRTRLTLLEAQATRGQADLVAHGRIFGRDTGFTFSNGVFVPDSSRGKPLTSAELVALVGADGCDALTFTSVPLGSGWRAGIDRDGDGFADGDELALGSDPTDPNSTP